MGWMAAAGMGFLFWMVVAGVLFLWITIPIMGMLRIKASGLNPKLKLFLILLLMLLYVTISIQLGNYIDFQINHALETSGK